MQLQVVEVAPPTLATTPGTYALHALGHPASSLTMLAGVGVGVYLGSVWIALALVVVALGTAWALAKSTGFQRAIDAYLVRRQRADRRRAREAALEQNGVLRDQLTELTAIVDDIERSDGGRAARRFELEDLLDHYVEVAIAHERALRALRATDRGALVRALGDASSRTGESARARRVLLERRIRTWDQCRTQAERLAEELASIVELIRLLAQRAACPDALPEDESIARRIADLDEEDAALRELAG